MFAEEGQIFAEEGKICAKEKGNICSQLQIFSLINCKLSTYLCTALQCALSRFPCRIKTIILHKLSGREREGEHMAYEVCWFINWQMKFQLKAMKFVIFQKQQHCTQCSTVGKLALALPWQQQQQQQKLRERQRSSSWACKQNARVTDPTTTTVRAKTTTTRATRAKRTCTSTVGKASLSLPRSLILPLPLAPRTPFHLLSRRS